MLRTASRLSPIGFSTLFPFFKSDNDVIAHKKYLSKEESTGIDRLKIMFTIDENEETSVELHSVGTATFTAAFIGACYGGFIRSRVAYVNFMENNKATAFKTHMEAKKKLQDHVTINFAKGAYQWGWRLAYFTGTFYMIATVTAVYRGKTSWIEYALAGAVTGALYKVPLGPAAILVGGGLGGVLGAIGGLTTVGLLALTGLTMDEMHEAIHRISQTRSHHYKEAEDKSSKEKYDDITRFHEQLVEEKGPMKIEDVK